MPFALDRTLRRDGQLLRRLQVTDAADLPAAEAAIAADLTAAARLDLVIAVRLYLARRHHPTAAAWVAWAEDRFGLARRTIYDCLAAADVLMRYGRTYEILLDCPRCILATLDTLEDARLALWLERHAAELPGLSRDALRAMLAGSPSVGGTVTAATPEDPSPAWQQLLLFDPNTLDPVTETLTLGAYAKRVEAVAAKLDDDTFDELIAGLEETIADLRAARAAAHNHQLANAS